MVAFGVGVAALVSSSEASATREVGLGATYEMNAPVGAFRSFSPNTSFTGFRARWDYYPLEALSTGVEFQYQLFQRDLVNDTVAIPDGAVTATTFRYASLLSVVPTVRYHFVALGALRPYLSFGAGVASLTAAVLVSDVSRRETSAAFIMQPSAGVFWRLSPERVPRPPDVTAGPGPIHRPTEPTFGLTASITYTFTTGDVVGANDISYAGIQLGIYAKP
jgi:hypothetical protein